MGSILGLDRPGRAFRKSPGLAARKPEAAPDQPGGLVDGCRGAQIGSVRGVPSGHDPAGRAAMRGVSPKCRKWGNQSWLQADFRVGFSVEDTEAGLRAG